MPVIKRAKKLPEPAINKNHLVFPVLSDQVKIAPAPATDASKTGQAVKPGQPVKIKVKSTRTPCQYIEWPLQRQTIVVTEALTTIPNLMGHFYMCWFLTSAYFLVSNRLEHSKLGMVCIFYA